MQSPSHHLLNQRRLAFSISTSLLMATMLGSSASGALAQTSPSGHGAAGAAQTGAAQNPNVAAQWQAELREGRNVFRFATFGNERFWTEAARLPQGIVKAKVTPLDALKLGIMVDIDRIDPATQQKIAAELKTDLSPAHAPLLNDPATVLKLFKANALVGMVPKNGKMGVTCAVCHAITDGSVYSMPNGGSIGHRLDGRTNHNLQVGKIFAVALNSRALYPILQLKMADGSTIGRAPQGLTKDSTEADVDAYLSNPRYYPVGEFDDTPDGLGNAIHITPLFRQDLAAPFGTSAQDATESGFNNTVYTALLDPTELTTPGGYVFLEGLAGSAGKKLIDDYVQVLASTHVTDYPYLNATHTGRPGTEYSPVGLRVDNDKLRDMKAYLFSLPAPQGVTTDVGAALRGRAVFNVNCSSCHNVDQGKPVRTALIPMKTIWPNYSPTVIAARKPPLSPIQNSPGTFDDKMVIVDASARGEIRGNALPMLLDLARKPVFLHNDIVHSLGRLLDPDRGPGAPHPFYVANKLQRADVVEFLKSLDTNGICPPVKR